MAEKNGEPEPRGILCIGNICLNMITYVSDFPKEDSDIQSESMDWDIGGNAVQNVMILRQLDAFCSFLGVCSNDSSLQFFANKLAEVDVSIQHCPVREEPMGISSVIVSKKTNTRTIVYSDHNLSPLTLDELKTFLDTEIDDIKFIAWIHFEARNIEETAKMMDYVIDRRNKESLDCKISLEVELPLPNVESLLDKPDVLFVSKNYSKYRGMTTMNSAAKEFAKRVKKGATVVCPWGEKGAFACVAGGGFRDVAQGKAYPPDKIIDPLGAGNAFTSGVIYAMFRGKPLDKSISFGCRIAGYKMANQGLSLEDMEGP